MPEHRIHEDALLGGRVRLLQPADGYRAAIDPVFLAAAVPDGGWRQALDVGAGTGAAMLCLMARRTDTHVTGLELLAEHAALARRAVALNGWEDRGRVVQGDVRAHPAPLPGNHFDQVLTNPPFHGPGSRPPDVGRAAAHMETVPLEAWLAFCLRMLRPRGGLTLIHRADRLDAILAALHGRAGAVEVVPLWPTVGQPAKRVIVRARKGLRSPAVLRPGLVLHEADGRYTAAAEAVLRHGMALDAAMQLDRGPRGGG